ncbi:hypothetical protein BDQ12DRAFT_319403 [Crucibulum laeve]|uniref:Uncharacterized protein n=1 Tax=Crucibulum laeve TaxID=68775 RepID=A0A5C3M370_9AGAR|nr:hypothetical protein BDQ12DRAFT_319403 [Crucibulum laeve]
MVQFVQMCALGCFRAQSCLTSQGTIRDSHMCHVVNTRNFNNIGFTLLLYYTNFLYPPTTSLISLIVINESPLSLSCNLLVEHCN